MYDDRRHTATDPACQDYRPPVGWWQTRHHDRMRHVGCAVCVPLAFAVLKVAAA